MAKQKAKSRLKPKPKPKPRVRKTKPVAKKARGLQRSPAAALSLEPDYRGVVVVRIRQSAVTTSLPSRVEEIPKIAALCQQYGVQLSCRLISSLSPDDLKRQEAQSKLATEESLDAYFRLDTRHLSVAQIDGLKAALESLPEIEIAYVESPASNPVSPSNDPLVAKQGYLKLAPTGIGVKWAWLKAGVTGKNVRIVDVEQGWHPHDDLPTFQALPGVPAEVNGEVDCKHGTMVLGILAARDNTKGGVGIAPDATISVASHFRADPSGIPTPVPSNACARPSDNSLNGHVADAITAVLDHLHPGDVILLEVQKEVEVVSGDGKVAVPTEFFDADFKAIRKAIKCEIVVVECAGNGAQDLDVIPFLDRNDSKFRDSGAIMVAACESKVSTKIVSNGGRSKITKGHKRWFGSNFGSRIDCHAWGENVATTGFTASNPNTFVTNFPGTSAAGAIVAGAAALVQSARKANGLKPLTPAQMRDVLRQTGTPQFPQSKKIGTMPNLKKAIPEALKLPELP